MFNYQQLLKYLALLAMLANCTVSMAALELFTDATPVQSVDPTFVARSRYVNINTAALLTATAATPEVTALPKIALNLFSDANFTGVVTKVQKTQGTTTWIGSLKDVPQSYFYLVWVDGAFIAHIGSLQGIYEVSSVGNNLYQVIQIDQSRLGDDAPGMMPAPGPVIKKASLGKNADSGDLIDVMVVYTAAARIKEGSAAAMKARVALAITETNQAYSKTGVVPRLRLVHTEEVDYTESGNLQTDVNRLTAPDDGYMDNVHPLRNTYGADMVSLIVENGGRDCGMPKTIMATAETAFDVVVRPACMTGYYTFGHEFGHLQGARHDIYSDPVITPFTYGHGFVSIPGKWRTVMAEDAACNARGLVCTRLQYFSNPAKTYGGAAMGVTGVSENNKVLDETRFTVANFRTTVIDANFDSQFNGATDGWSAVKGSWTVDPSYYKTSGISNRTSSSTRPGTYGDLTFKASLYRTGCSFCANTLFIRGNPSSLDAFNTWNSSYLFQYTNDGTFSVWKMSPVGEATRLKQWTNSSAIKKNGWNTLKVVAVDSVLQFYINGTLVWTGADGDYKTGSVGIGMYRDAVSTNNTLFVDWASVETSATAADTRTQSATPRGAALSGGSVNSGGSVSATLSGGSVNESPSPAK